MKQLWKWAGILGGSIILLLIIAIASITLFLDPNQFKPVIISKFKQLTGLEISIPGQLSWSFFPHLGVEISEAKITRGPQLSSTVNHLVLKIRLAPLFHHQLELSKVSVDHWQFNQVHLSKVYAKVQLNNDTLTILPVQANFYQGTVRGEATVSLKKPAPILHISSTLKNVDMASLTNDLLGKNAKLKISGTGNTTIDTNTTGKTTDELLAQLNGTGHFSLDKGLIHGIDIAFFVDTANALINHQSLPTQLPNNSTEFGQLTGTFTIKKGIVYNADLLLESPFYTTRGNGSVNLLNKTMDYHLEVTVKVGSTNNKILALAGKTVPIHVSGNWSNPTVTLDTLALMQEIGKEQLQKIGDKIDKALPPKASQFLKNMFH